MEYKHNLREIIYEAVNEEYVWRKYGEFRVLIRKKDGYVNANKLCIDGGKRYDSWSRLNGSKKLIEEFESLSQICMRETILDLPNDLRGTYVHQDLIPHIACWISPKFAVSISRILREWKDMSALNEERYWNELCDCVANYPSAQNDEEKKWQLMIAERESGQIEVETQRGRIDVLSNSQIIEVKRACNWKHAIGQVICYSREVRDRQLKICLFDCHDANKEIINEDCLFLGIEVEYLD